MSRANQKVSGDGAGLLPYLLLCLAPFIWGWSGVLVRWAALPGEEYVLIFWRSAFAFAFFALAIIVARNAGLARPGSKPLLLIASGLTTAAYAVCAFKAYYLLDIGAATFIIYLAPVFVALLAPFALKEKLERSTLVCLTIALLGTALLSFDRAGEAVGTRVSGALLALGAAVCWALLMIIWKKLRETHSTFTIGLWTNGVCAVVYVPFAVIGSDSLSAKGWLSIAVLGFIVIGGASVTFLYAVKRVKAQDAGLLSYIEPVSAMVLGIALLGETPHWQEFVGAALIIAAGVLLLRFRLGAGKVAEVFDAAER